MSLRISLFQYDITWENPAANRKYLAEKIKTLAGQTDIIILPEMFATGFTMAVEKFAETMQGETLHWMQEMAQLSKTAICGSVIISEEGKIFNRFIWLQPDGLMFHYDKKHLFSMAGEDIKYTAGSKRMVINYKDWNILPLVCYDLRFPLWARNVKNAYDLLIYVANWPERRIAHWDALLKARAIENQCYVAGVNRIGKDGNNINHVGHSALYDYLGNALIEPFETENIRTIEINKSGLNEYREKFPVWKDADDFEILK